MPKIAARAMKSGRFTHVSIAAALALAGFGVFMWWRFATPRSSGQSSVAPSSAPATEESNAIRPGSETSDADSTRRAMLPTYAERLAEAQSLVDPSRRRLKRAEILAEWIEQDFHGAFRYLETGGFEALSLPGIAQMIAAGASAEDLLTIANKATYTTDALLAVGPHLSPARTAELAALTGRVDGSRVRDAAGVISNLLARQNLDAALRFATSLAGSVGEAAAYAGIIDELAFDNSPAEAQALWNSLPETVRSEDSVLFARGNALRDTDPATALESLATIGDAETRKLALVNFARKTEARSPAAAIQAIVDSGLGPGGIENHVARILGTWRVHDAEAARAFIGSAEWLSNDQRARWLALIDQPSMPMATPLP